MSIHTGGHGEGCGQHGWPDFDRPAAPADARPPLGGQSGGAFRSANLQNSKTSKTSKNLQTSIYPLPPAAIDFTPHVTNPARVIAAGEARKMSARQPESLATVGAAHDAPHQPLFVEVPAHGSGAGRRRNCAAAASRLVCWILLASMA